MLKTIEGALSYCAQDPARMHPQSQSQRLIAEKALSDLQALQKTHVLVPREPTDEMMSVGRSESMTWPNHRAHEYIYKAMIQASEDGE